MTRSSRVVAVLALCSASAVASAQAQPNVNRMRFTPTVVPENYTQPVLFEAEVTGNPATVAFEYDGVDRPMYDDGTNGDRVAGDGTWTIRFQPAEILGKLTAAWVFRPFIGYCKPGGAGRFNVFAEIWTAAVGLVNVVALDATTQQTDYVVNQVVSAAELLTPNYQQIAQRFYARHGDDFDFLNIVLLPGVRGNRFHFNVRNAVSGVGLPLVNNAALYGSAGRLQGLNVFPISSLFDGAGAGINHETGHQWINFLAGTPFASGTPHWPKGDIGINVMGVSIPGGNVGGMYPWTFTPNGVGGYVVAFNQGPNANTTAFNAMELYLMGLVPPNEVGTFFVLKDQNQDVTPGQVLQPSEVTPVTVADVVAAVGPRTPDSNSSQRAFRFATILLSEQLLDIRALSLYDWFARRAELIQSVPCSEGFATFTCKPFAVATGGRATMSSRVSPSTAGPAMTLDKTSLRFGAVSNGAALLSQTAPQIVRLTQTGAGTATWTAASSQPWLQVSPASGTGPATLSIAITGAGGLPAMGTSAAFVSFTFAGAGTVSNAIGVALNVVPNGTSAAPIGIVDTPVDNRTGVTGAVPFTGWALDDIEVVRVSVCRAGFGAEIAPVDPNCGGVAQIFVGFAVFIDGARPDVAAAFPSYPANTKAGWGFMVLTNMLPSQGNGTYLFYMWAHDREGHAVLLGTRTMTCANASATLPFGAIDTPEQGGLASGVSYVNFGWALTPLPKTIPADGSTISVLIDGVAVGTATYNNFRPDIATFFPGYNNTNGAVGYRILDTTTLANGTHTIVWVVTDDQGAIEGIGSRYFTVSNGTTGTVTAAAADRPAAAAAPETSILGRRGWDLHAPLQSFVPDASGRVVVFSEEVSRVELQLGAGSYAGYLRTAGGLQPMPVGTHLDRSSGAFSWTPGVGFVGPYDFVFTREDDSGRSVEREVTIVLQPKGRASVGPQVVLDAPRSQQQLAQPFTVSGWAVDLRAMEGTGVASVLAWAHPSTGGAPIFLGPADYGHPRPDVAAVHGERFEMSGFTIPVQGLAAGTYDLAVFAWSSERAEFVPARSVRVRVRQQ